MTTLLDQPLDPMFLFREFTYLGFGEAGEKSAKLLIKNLVARRYFPFIDEHPEMGWVFHSMGTPYETYRKPIAEHFGTKGKPTSHSEALKKGKARERAIHDGLMDALRRQGENPREFVECKAGIIDILTDRHVIEVEQRLDRLRMFEAVGQVTLYRKAIRPQRRPVIVGYRDPKADKLLDCVLGLRIAVWFVGPRDGFELAGVTLAIEELEKLKTTSPNATEALDALLEAQRKFRALMS